ncbi:MAG: tRNA lysidine(34) synthetase TilS, partial [Rectinemataceae bacterium]|nr:tRNA lysidine(34) synthetase TilS [Rectinemataceae bacterium]
VQILEKKGKTFRGSGFSVRHAGDRLILEYGLDFPGCGGYFVEVDTPGEYRMGRFFLKLAWKYGNSVQGLREGSFSFPFVIRSKLPGDCIVTECGTKKLDELFAEWKIPQKTRDIIPVIEDRDGIIAVWGSVAGMKDRYRSPDNSNRAGFPVAVKSSGLEGTGRILSILFKGVRVSDGF